MVLKDEVKGKVYEAYHPEIGKVVFDATNPSKEDVKRAIKLKVFAHLFESPKPTKQTKQEPLI